MTSLLIIVPARGGSKRLPGKNLRTLGGRPLLDHTDEVIRQAGLGERPCLLSTDDPRIAERGRTLGWTVPWLRPAALAGDQTPTVDAVLHALDWFAETECGDPERVMVLQPTSPLRGPDCLAQAIATLDERAEADAVIGMRRLHLPGNALYDLNQDGFVAPAAVQGDLVPNGAVYLIRTSALRAHHSLYAPRTLPLVMDAGQSIDIDTEFDWMVAEAALQSRVDSRADLTSMAR